MARKNLGYRKKISIDFDDKSLKSLEQLKNEVPFTGNVSNSSVINYLLVTFAGLNGYVKCNFAREAKRLIRELEKRIGEFEDENSFELIEDRKTLEQLKRIFDFFARGQDLSGEELYNMVRTNLKNGYVIYPQDWVVLSVESPEKSINAVVIETRNGDKYNIPHFIFFTKETRITQRISELALSEVVKKCPIYQKILDSKVVPVFDSEGNVLNIEEWRESLEPALFFIQDADNPVGSIAGYPFGAKVYRNRKNEGEVE